jgi:hypothetical protein
MLRKKTIQLSWAIALMAASLSVLSHNKVVVIPLAGDDVPPDFKVVFVTESKWTGNLGGPTGADQKCMDESLLPGSRVKGRKFRAWIGGTSFPSDLQVGTRSFTRSHLPYKTVTGVTVADDYADLVSGTLNAPINASHTGTIVQTDVWTGIRTDGWDGYSDGLNCAGFTVSNIHSSIRGNSGSTGYHWTGQATTGGASNDVCFAQMGLYCFEQ